MESSFYNVADVYSKIENKGQLLPNKTYLISKKKTHIASFATSVMHKSFYVLMAGLVPAFKHNSVLQHRR